MANSKSCIKKLSTHELTASKAEIYRLKHSEPTTTTLGVNEYFVNVCNLSGHELQQQEGLPEKVIMMIGETGVGKSTLINRMINHIFGVEYSESYRFQLIQEFDSAQTQSQTTHINKYNIIFKDSQFTEFRLSLIDTPGFNDTRGKQADQRTIMQIKELFEKIVSIDAICFAIKYNSRRLTEAQMNIFTIIARIFGKDVKENIFVFTTHCDNVYDYQDDDVDNGDAGNDDDRKKIAKAPVLECFEQNRVPYRTSLPFNNKGIYDPPVNPKSPTGLINAFAWETSEISFKHFLRELKITPTVSLKLSEEILQKYHNIRHVQLPNLIQALKKSIAKVDEHKKDMELLERKIQNPDENFAETVKVTKVVMVKIQEPGIFSLKCKKCQRICHYPCGQEFPKSISCCAVMSKINLKFNIHCTVCETQCSWRDHERINEQEKFVTVEEIRTNEQLKEKYLKDKNTEKDEAIKVCEDDLVSAYDTLLESLKTINTFIEYVNQNSISESFSASLEEFINAQIQNEANSREDGCETRIRVLTKLVKAIEVGGGIIALLHDERNAKLQQANQLFISDQ